MFDLCQVELIDWLGEDLSPDKSKSIVKEQIEAGSGYGNPTEGGMVEGKKKKVYI